MNEPPEKTKATPLLERLQRGWGGRRTQQVWTLDVRPLQDTWWRRKEKQRERMQPRAKDKLTTIYLVYYFTRPESLLHQHQTPDQTQRHEYLISPTPSFFYFSPRLHFCKVVSLHIFFFIFCFSDQRSRLEVRRWPFHHLPSTNPSTMSAAGFVPSGRYCVTSVNRWEKTTRGNRKYLYPHNRRHHHPARLCF